MTKNIMIVGVGGQGTLLTSRILGGLAIEAGFDVKISEVHGMAQRGGSVVTYVRYGEGVASPIIGIGGADIVLAFEELEAYRSLPYLKKGGRISAAAAIAGSVLSIKPVIAIEHGEVVVLGKARGSRNGHNMLKELKLSHGFEREKKEALTVAQEKLFFDYMLSHPKDTHWYPVFYVMANTGMRVGEITGLRWRDIDLEKGVISVNHTLVYYNHRDEKGCYFSINTPKTKAGEREIPMTEGVKQAFLMEREFQSQAEISSKSRVDGYDDFIFVNRYGDVQNQGNLNKALRRMMRDCNDEILEKYGADSDPVLLPQFSCHILRHTFATRLCESGANLKFIQSILGHADVSTTMNIYVDVTDALKKKEITAFDDYMTTKLET